MLVLISSASCTLKDQEGREAKMSQDAQVATRSSATWDYPVKPGMAAWNQIKTMQERIAVLQVPESILASLPTDEIVDLCIRFPFFIYYTAYSSPQAGFSKMVEQFNIFSE